MPDTSAIDPPLRDQELADSEQVAQPPHGMPHSDYSRVDTWVSRPSLVEMLVSAVVHQNGLALLLETIEYQYQTPSGGDAV